MLAKLFICFMLQVSLNPSQIQLQDIFDYMHKNMPFDVSPRYIDFRPDEVLKNKIQVFAQSNDPENITAISDSLYSAKDGYDALALLRIIQQYYIIDKYHLSEGVSILKTYREMLQNDKTKISGESPFIDKKRLLLEVNTMLNYDQ